MAFAARYPGYCQDCGEPFEPGTQIRYEGLNVVHERCPGPEPAVKPGETLCPRCMAYHPGEC